MTDLYRVFGVSKDATQDELKAAFRKMAKQSHPDFGGSEEEFRNVKQASLTLLNPEKRRKYDTDGTVDDANPDNTTSVAMQKVASFFINSINGMIDQNMDPNQFDLVAGARLAFKQEITDKTNNIENIERKISNFKKTAKRLKSKKSKDVIALLLANHIGQLARTIDANWKDIQIAKEADAIVSDYEFEQDPTQMILTPFGRIFR